MAVPTNLVKLMIEEAGDQALAMAILFALTEDSMERLLRACVELDPKHRETHAILMEAHDESESRCSPSFKFV